MGVDNPALSNIKTKYTSGFHQSLETVSLEGCFLCVCMFAMDENIDFLPGIKLRIFTVKYTAVPIDFLNGFCYHLSLFLKGGENSGNTIYNLSPFWF